MQQNNAPLFLQHKLWLTAVSHQKSLAYKDAVTSGANVQFRRTAGGDHSSHGSEGTRRLLTRSTGFHWLQTLTVFILTSILKAQGYSKEKTVWLWQLTYQDECLENWERCVYRTETFLRYISIRTDHTLYEIILLILNMKTPSWTEIVNRVSRTELTKQQVHRSSFFKLFYSVMLTSTPNISKLFGNEHKHQRPGCYLSTRQTTRSSTHVHDHHDDYHDRNHESGLSWLQMKGLAELRAHDGQCA